MLTKKQKIYNEIKTAFELVYPEAVFESLRVRPPHAGLRSAYAQGFRYCAFDLYIVKTDIDFCPKCGRKFRRNTRTKTARIFPESRARVEEVKI